MKVYLDNSATTKPYEEVVEAMINSLTKDFYNPSAAYKKGSDIEKKIKIVRENIANTLKANENQIVFTSGGTESNNSIIKSVAYKNKKRRNHIITSKIEHPSVLNVVKCLEEDGFDVTYLNVDENGIVDLEQLKDVLNKKTCLVSIMYVNNEIGSIQPINEISKIIKEKYNNEEKPYFHVDSVQAYGKFNVNIKNLDVDFLSVSAHKIHGPKGIGFMYIKEVNKFKPLLEGGGQERNLRSGTENIPGIYGLGKAVEVLFKHIDYKINNIIEVKKYLYNSLLEEIGNIKLNSNLDSGVCHILNITFEGVKGEVLLHFLEQDGICVSTGSACSSKKKGSHVLRAIGLNANDVDSAIRFSLNEFNTTEEIDYVVAKLKKHIDFIKKIKTNN